MCVCVCVSVCVCVCVTLGDTEVTITLISCIMLFFLNTKVWAQRLQVSLTVKHHFPLLSRHMKVSNDIYQLKHHAISMLVTLK